MKYFIQINDQTVKRPKAKEVHLESWLTIILTANKTKHVFGKVSPGC